MGIVGMPALAARGVFVPPLERLVASLEIGREIAAVVVRGQQAARRRPALGVPPLHDAVVARHRRALGFAEIDFTAQARAREPARVARQRPAHRLRGGPVVVHVLLDLVGAPPQHLGFEPLGRGVAGKARKFGVDHTFEPVEHQAKADTVEGIVPVDLGAQADGVVVAVRKAEPQEQPPGR